MGTGDLRERRKITLEVGMRSGAMDEFLLQLSESHAPCTAQVSTYPSMLLSFVSLLKSQISEYGKEFRFETCVALTWDRLGTEDRLACLPAAEPLFA